ncbi:hypothetical protein ACOMHN_035091 [Nucella lapillus]
MSLDLSNANNNDNNNNAASTTTTTTTTATRTPTPKNLQNPRIVEHPTDKYVARNEPAKLNCKAEGSPAPKITWYRNGERVMTSSDVQASHRMLLNKGQQLFFLRIIHNKNAKPDVGSYYCNATNVHGSAISRSASLQLAVLREDFRENPQPVTVVAGDSATLHCRPPRGQPEPKVLWRKDGSPLAEDGRFSVTGEGDLIIASAEPSDAGDYTCLALNKGGERESAPAYLTVLALPSFLIKPTNQRVGVGRVAILQCVVTGNPPPTVFWNKGKEQHLMFPNHEHGRYAVSADGTLRIRDTRYQDAGQYYCNGLNALGTEQAVATIEVKEEEHRPPPMMVMGPQNQTLETKGVALLPCRAQGSPPPTLRWFHHGRPLVGSEPRLTVLNSGTLQISDLRISDSGLYTCRAFSETGESSWEAFLTVTRQGPFHRMPKASTFPPAPPTPQVTRVTDISLLVTWGVQGGGEKEGEGAANSPPQSPPLFYDLQSFCWGSPEHGWATVAQSISGSSHTVIDLKPGDRCVFVVRARNTYGVSPPSDPSDPVHLPVLAQPPQDIVVHKEGNSIHIRWSPPPPPQAHTLEGYQIFCTDDDSSHNCSAWTDDVTTSVQIDDVDPELTYRIRLAAVTHYGTGTWSETFVVGPEKSGLLEEPWFLGVVIGVVGGVVWLSLCLFTLCLCRKRKHRKKMAQNGMYSAVPVQKPEQSHSGVASLLHKNQAHGKERGGGRGGGGELEGGEEGGMYSVASPLDRQSSREDQDTALYQEPISLPKTALPTSSHIPAPVEPYATTTIVTSTAGGGGGVGGGGGGGTWSTFERSTAGSRCLDATFRPVNHAYVHSSASGSGDSGHVTGMRIADQGDATLANTGCHPEDPSKGNTFAIQRSSNNNIINNNNNDSTDDSDGHMVRHHPFQNPGVLPGEGSQPSLHWTQLVPLPRGRPPPLNEMDSSMLNCSAAAAANTANTGRADFGAEGMVRGFPPPEQDHFGCMAGFLDGHAQHSSSSSSSSKSYACTCPAGVREQGLHGTAAPAMPCYSDSEWCCSGGTGHHHHHPHPPHLQPNSRYPNLGPSSFVPPQQPPSALTMNNPPPIPGVLDDPRVMMSDSETGGRGDFHCHQHPILGGGRPVGECGGPQVDRACQSSLPSLANECIHSPGGGSSRNLESDYTAESESDAERIRDCPTPTSSANGDEAAATNVSQGSGVTSSP